MVVRSARGSVVPNPDATSYLDISFPPLHKHSKVSNSADF